MIRGRVANVIKGFSRDRHHMRLTNFECVRGFDTYCGIGRGIGVALPLGATQRISQVKSTAGPQSKAPAGMRMVLRPGTTGEMKKWKVIVVLAFVKATEPDEIPLIVKSLAWTVDGSTGSLMFTTKSVGRVKMVIALEGLVTEQGVAISEATLTRNVIIAIIKVGVRAIFTSRYHFVVA
jgi:hypothetical protein